MGLEGDVMVDAWQKLQRLVADDLSGSSECRVCFAATSLSAAVGGGARVSLSIAPVRTAQTLRDRLARARRVKLDQCVWRAGLLRKAQLRLQALDQAALREVALTPVAIKAAVEHARASGIDSMLIHKLLIEVLEKATATEVVATLQGVLKGVLTAAPVLGRNDCGAWGWSQQVVAAARRKLQQCAKAELLEALSATTVRLKTIKAAAARAKAASVDKDWLRALLRELCEAAEAGGGAAALEVGTDAIAAAGLDGDATVTDARRQLLILASAEVHPRPLAQLDLDALDLDALRCGIISSLDVLARAMRVGVAEPLLQPATERLELLEEAERIAAEALREKLVDRVWLARLKAAASPTLTLLLNAANAIGDIDLLKPHVQCFLEKAIKTGNVSAFEQMAAFARAHALAIDVAALREKSSSALPVSLSAAPPSVEYESSGVSGGAPAADRADGGAALASAALASAALAALSKVATKSSSALKEARALRDKLLLEKEARSRRSFDEARAAGAAAIERRASQLPTPTAAAHAQRLLQGENVEVRKWLNGLLAKVEKRVTYSGDRQGKLRFKPKNTCCDAASVDPKLWSGAAQEGWTLEVHSGLSNYVYVAPNGKKFSSKAGAKDSRYAGWAMVINVEDEEGKLGSDELADAILGAPSSMSDAHASSADPATDEDDSTQILTPWLDGFCGGSMEGALDETSLLRELSLTPRLPSPTMCALFDRALFDHADEPSSGAPLGALAPSSVQLHTAPAADAAAASAPAAEPQRLQMPPPPPPTKTKRKPGAAAASTPVAKRYRQPPKQQPPPMPLPPLSTDAGLESTTGDDGGTGGRASSPCARSGSSVAAAASPARSSPGDAAPLLRDEDWAWARKPGAKVMYRTSEGTVASYSTAGMLNIQFTGRRVGDLVAYSVTNEHVSNPLAITGRRHR